MSSAVDHRPSFGWTVRKLGRTAQVHIPFLRGLGKAGESGVRRLLRAPHDADFKGLRRIARPPKALCLDVGANRGAAARSIRALWPDARVVCFEPLGPLAEQLGRRSGLAVEVHALALSDQSGTFDLYAPVYNGLLFDGLASLDRDAARSWLGPDTVYGFRPDRLQLRRIPCRTETLDAFGYAPFLIKIDVQGRELAVIQGGLRTILDHRPVILAENDALEVGRILDLLAPAAYRCFAFRDGWRPDETGAANLYLVPADKVAVLGEPDA